MSNRNKHGQFVKGNPGKPRGAKNAVKRDIQQAFRQLVEGNLDDMQHWITKTAEKRPERALEIVLKLSEFIVPKKSSISIENMTEPELDAIVEHLKHKENDSIE